MESHAKNTKIRVMSKERENKTLKNYKCEHCYSAFSSKKIRWKHIRKMHSDTRKFRCKVCSNVFSTRKLLITHKGEVHAIKEKRMLIKSPEVQLVKLESSPSTPTSSVSSELVPSTQIIWADKNFCNYCPRAFATPGTRKIHERLHTGETPFACPHCDLSFRLKLTLSQHVKDHESGKFLIKKKSPGVSRRVSCDFNLEIVDETNDSRLAIYDFDDEDGSKRNRKLKKR